MIRSHVIHITTDASGDATVYSVPFDGLLDQIIYVPGTLATGADLTITDDATGLALVTVTNGGTSAVRILPRAPQVDAANAASLYASAGEPVEGRMAVVGRVKIVVAQGGNGGVGRLYVVWEE